MFFLNCSVSNLKDSSLCFSLIIIMHTSDSQGHQGVLENNSKQPQAIHCKGGMYVHVTDIMMMSSRVT